MIEKVGSIMSMAQEFGGGGAAVAGDALSDEASDYLKVLSQAMPGINSLATRFLGGAEHQPMPQQYTPQPQPVPQQIPQQIPQHVQRPIPQPTPQATPRPAPAPQRVRIQKEDLEGATTLLSLALQAGTNPESAANSAISNGDNRMLYELARRKPDAVIAELGKLGLLDEHLSTDEGIKYTASVLGELRTRLVDRA